VQRLKDKMRFSSDKMAYQTEHGNLQFEALRGLEAQKQRCEGEVEVLTLGLHDAEQRNQYLQKENDLMQQQVEGRYHGSLQEWAADVQRIKVASEVVRYKEEIDMWKQKAELLRKERQQDVARVQRQHEDAGRGLRDKIALLQSELAECEHKVARREAAIDRCRQRGEPEDGAPGLQGLVVPQRPLHAGSLRRKALLVGINYVGSHAPLKGCVNDVWNMQCLLRYTLRYNDDQLRLLLDGADGRVPKPERAPTKANILAGLQWLIAGARPGDNLLFVFSGYGAQHPRTPSRTDTSCEGYLVASDFAEDLPTDFFAKPPPEVPLRLAANGEVEEVGPGYRLVSLLELNDHVVRLPPGCRLTIVLDCCYSVCPSISPASNFAPTFPKVERGRVDYGKLRDFISRPRFLELPVLPVRHAPRHLRASTFPTCWLHCFSACRLQEWCAEFPIEGTVQGAFSWAFLKALARGHFHCGVYQFLRTLADIMTDLRLHFKGVEQTPVLQLSQTAAMQDVILWT
jgi:hypothetical protein